MAEPHLMTGWEPDVDVSDTLLRRQVHNLAARYRHCAERADAPLIEDDDVVGVLLSTDSVWGNDLVVLHPLDQGRWGEVVDRIEHRTPCAVNLWSAWPTPDLSRLGLIPFGHPPSMLRPPGGSAPSLPAGLEITEVDDEAAVHEYDRVVADGFPLNGPDGQPVRGLFRPRFAEGPFRFFVGRVDGEPASVAAVFVAHGIAQVEWVATLTEHRGRGYGEAVTWRATLAEPSLPAMLLASDLGRPIYERMGYLPLLRFSMWHLPAEQHRAPG